MPLPHNSRPATGNLHTLLESTQYTPPVLGQVQHPPVPLPQLPKTSPSMMKQFLLHKEVYFPKTLLNGLNMFWNYTLQLHNIIFHFLIIHSAELSMRVLPSQLLIESLLYFERTELMVMDDKY
jgi:hypothetical protein